MEDGNAGSSTEYGNSSDRIADRPAMVAYDHAGRLSRLFLTWMSTLIKISSQKPLQFEDLGPISRQFSVEYLSQKLTGDGELPCRSDMKTLARICLCLFRAFGAEFVASGILKFLGDCASLTSPLVLRQLLHLIRIRNDAPNNPSLHDWQMAILLAVMIFALQSVNSISVNLYFQRTFQCGFKVRSSLVDLIYRKSLKLSLHAKKEFSPAKIVNLVSVDCFRIDTSISFLHYLWSGIFQCIVIVAMLYHLLGWSSLVGLALFLLFFPIQGKIVTAISRQRKRVSHHTDQRLKSMSELISGIKIIKTHGWEEEAVRRIAEIRLAEMSNIRRIQMLHASMATITWLIPVCACIGTFLVYRHLNGKLPIDLILPALAYFNLLRVPLILLPSVIGFATDARVALIRISELMSAEERVDYIENSSDQSVFKITDAEFIWQNENTQSEHLFKLTVKALKIDHGELVCVVGPIGSGKSSFIHTLLGELHLLTGSVKMQKECRIAYCPQVPWILTGTIRDNIVFGHLFQEDLYDRVLNVCQLRPDLDLFPSGDLTVVGERGITLSGGQKQRLSLARAVYSQSDIYILDDPLSALDARVANAVWEECICGILAGKTRVIVTHSQKHVLGQRTLTFDQGGIVSDMKFLREPDRSIDASPQKSVDYKQHNSLLSAKASEKVSEEERAIGTISSKVLTKYAEFFGGTRFIVLVALSLILNQAAKIASDLWLSNEENMTDLGEKKFAIVYGVSGLAQGLCIFFVNILFNLGTLSAAVKIHDSALEGLLRAPLMFFEKTSSGRILNRFSRDVDATDNQMAECIRSVSTSASGAIATLILTMCLAWPSFFVIIPALFLFNKIQRSFRPPVRDLKRLDALSKAPLFSHISESLGGSMIIRAFHDEQRFIHQLRQTLDKNGVPVILNLSLQRWVSLRLEMIGNILVLAASIFAYATAVIFSFAGLAIIYALSTTGALNWLIRRFAEAETLMVATERLQYYSTELPSEIEPATRVVDESWPKEGEIDIRNLTISYKPDRPPALVDFNLHVEPGEHIGIVGRTGAGKSTIISSFFRLYNVATTGSIVIDDVDISQISLGTLRRRFAIIPQDPILFSGTVRSNLDPFSKYDDSELWLALKRSGLAPIITRSSAGLDAIVEAQGENWSAGERQLLCLARALLAKARIVLMDEATSSVDPETDAAIQECISSDLAGSTVLIVAHRINTVMHCNRVIVLDAGRIVEQGPPRELAKSSGLFSMFLSQQLTQTR